MQLFKGYLEAGKQLQKSILTIGNLDGLHIGHQELIRRADAVYTFSPHPSQVLANKSKPPMLMTDEQKLRGLEALNVKNIVVEPFTQLFSTLSAIDFIEKILIKGLGVREVVVGDNFRFGYQGKGDAQLLKSHLSCQIVPSIQIDGHICSSTTIRRLIQNGEVRRATQFLGRPYSIEGIVVKGAGRGKLIGIPTANLDTPNEVIPQNGVYATWVRIGNSIWRGATNIGERPTFNGDHARHIETHIIDFSDDLYGQKIELFFTEHLRGEIRFNSAQELQKQIQADILLTTARDGQDLNIRRWLKLKY